MKLKLVAVFAVSALAGFAAGCQTYDFEPVIPLAISQTTQAKTVVAKQLKPDLMFLIDKSGSMNFPSNPALMACVNAVPAGSCSAQSTSCTAAGCPTRIQELRAAMGQFLTMNGNVAWTGMAVYPTRNGDQCAPTTTQDVVVQLAPNKTDLDADLNSAAMAVNTQIQGLMPGGGTPTADSLRYLATYAPLLQNKDRQNFVLLLTDGLPNCNQGNANTCVSGTPAGAACKCTLATCSMGNGYCSKGCLDSDNSSLAISELAKKGIRTIVVGFGADFGAAGSTGDGPDTLNAMAEAGGFKRICPKGTDAECGTNNTCNVATGACTKKFYQATSANELATTLADISKSLIIGDPCVYSLNTIPSDPRFLSVIIDGTTIPAKDPNGWDYAAGQVTFKGTLCSNISNATPDHPVKVEFRIVESL
jgi:hypothetical protein